ncbi:aminomethyl-transferring glycine dehydrogenase [Porphyromonas asaccharolytica]|uniref:glycine dehydrogenase (aminomethyl-transferring) n=1 Tax=Porphyromonas asaccharolytica (strain ATCC 25260 / DSM 20707 / BCRC 10618 / CCUG 7834 / JCM 6326 / LMG 13178 / VPI 4198 / B440) TaxID=879243 RepID=F4KK50_PORAD|nr:aminomethyl-transferring glycine dehydrogenase [Porphyromonas asaccharolytica]AEE12775.1 glycine dehydrogenase [Porphyromonas asaccharolytica DSM 20707]
MDTRNFAYRHIGISEADLPEMLKVVGVDSVDALMHKVYPEGIFLEKPLDLPEPMTERELSEHLFELGSRNRIFTSYIGMGWYDTVTPQPIIRNVLENPVWYTSYTPYQAEVSQGRLEALFNFQTVITDLTGLPLTNCSLLDEATAGAEAALMLYNERSREQKKAGANQLFVDKRVFASTQAVIQTRVPQQGMEIVVGDYETFDFTDKVFGAIIQYPDEKGSIHCYHDFMERAKAAGVRVAVAADLMSLVLLTPPGEWGADIVFGSAQRFGIPMYFGGPSAGYLASTMDYKRTIPGRIIGISKDTYGRPAYRLALQTREQHIKRERATSNICTAQALLATMSGFYAVYHGPEGLRDIAHRIHAYAGYLAEQLEAMGYKQLNDNFFDTLYIELPEGLAAEKLREIALDCQVNLRYYEDGRHIGISIDETTLESDLSVLLYIFAQLQGKEGDIEGVEVDETKVYFDKQFARQSDFLQYETFQKYHSETELMRYIKRLDRKDISLAQSMISLGSCTMKLNAASEVAQLSNPQFANIHPYAPDDQVEGYLEMIRNLSALLCEITGMKGASLQPNSGAAGEYTGLRVIRSYLQATGQGARDLIILPASAHGTNPASAVQAGFDTITVRTADNGDINMDHFMELTEQYKDRIAAIMITYPSTHGIFESNIRTIIDRIHEIGGQVYMDGANLNAQVGWTNPGYMGADVCHLNLHKTFAIPHGGGGPGVGPICVTEHLVPHLPKHVERWSDATNQVSAAPFGSAGVFVITYAYIRLLGYEGLRQATAMAILNANYLKARFHDNYGVVYTGDRGFVGHEMILDCRGVKAQAGVDEGDISKRLMDFGYHAPTVSFPVHGTLMIEPTESESKAELDRFVAVMNQIYQEAQDIASGKADAEDNVIKNAPHPQYEVCADEWHHAYTRQQAAFALPYLEDNKFWVNVSRIDNGFGDRNLIPAFCACTPEIIDQLNK